MNSNIQELLDNCNLNESINLPQGEFEGPFYIKKPCTISGSQTTFWAKKGPVIVIEKSSVTIQNLRVEITELPLSFDDFVCIRSSSTDTRYKNVEIIGNVVGVPNEENEWYIPKILPLGEFPAESANSFVLEVNVPNSVNLRTTIKDISIFPTKLKPGINKVTISTEKLKDGTFLYGELLFESVFIRRAYLNGNSRANLTGFENNKIIYKAINNNSDTNAQYHNLVPATNIIAPMVSDPNITILKKGQRLSINDLLGNSVQVNFFYSNMIQQMDVDPYVFLLNQNGKVTNDEDLIFFGNPSSKCGSVKYVTEDSNKSIILELKKVPDSVHTISIAYSIYGDNANQNFSKIINPTIRIQFDDKEKLRFSANDLFIEKTIVFVDFYRFKDQWKLNTVGAGYKDGLKRLCESFGLVVS